MFCRLRSSVVLVAMSVDVLRVPGASLDAFIADPAVRLIGVEAGGEQISRGRHAARFAGGRAGQFAEVNGTGSIDDAIFEINPDLGVGPLEQFLNLTEERLVHRRSEGLKSSSRLSS